MLLNARQIYRKDIGAKMILLAIEDITERKRLENLLTESEERYRRLFETASDGIVLLEKREGKITHANPATEKMLGYTKKESIGNKLQDIGVLLDMGDFQTTMQNLNKSGIINYDDVPVKTKSGQHIDTDIYLVDRARLVQCNIRDITDRKQGEQIVGTEYTMMRLDGSVFPAIVISSVIYSAGKPVGLRGAIIDITERKRAEETLRQSEEKYRTILENIEDGYYEVDLNGNFTFFNDSMCRILGYPQEEMMGMNNRQFTDKENAKKLFKTFNEVYQQGNPPKNSIGRL